MKSRRARSAPSLALVCLALAAALHARARAEVPGVVLHETHTQSSVARIDTIHTYFTPDHVLIVHAGGRTLLDWVRKRIVSIGPDGGEARSVALQEWEAELQKAGEGQEVDGDDSSRFEAQRRDEEIAGYRCVRYHHFGRRTLLGSQEYVEQQIWVTQEIDMPRETYEAYRHAFDRVENIGRSQAVQRPPGVVLAAETRTWPVAGNPGDAAQVERYSVYAVERRDLPESLFRILDGTADADTATSDSGTLGPGRH